MSRVAVAIAVVMMFAVRCGDDDGGALGDTTADEASTDDGATPEPVGVSLAGRAFAVNVAGTKADTGEPFPGYFQCLTFAEDGSWVNRYHSDNAEVARGTWSETVDGEQVSFSVSAEFSFIGITLHLDQTGTVTPSDDGFGLSADNVVTIDATGSFEPFEQSVSEGTEIPDCS